MKSAIFGRYWAAKSPIHSLDPRAKLLGTLWLVVIIFLAASPWAFAAIAIAMAGIFLLAKIPLSQGLKSVAPLLFIVVFTALFTILFNSEGVALFSFGPITITMAGLKSAAFFSVRLWLLLLAGSLLTLTTTTVDITRASEQLLRPAKKLHFPVAEFSFVLGTALRFVPQFAQEFQIVRSAALCRGAKLSTSPIKGPLRYLSALLVPMFTSVFRHGDTLAFAMEARCFDSSVEPSTLQPLVYKKSDAVTSVALGVLLAVVLALNGF